jgi:hypothetical protein
MPSVTYIFSFAPLSLLIWDLNKPCLFQRHHLSHVGGTHETKYHTKRPRRRELCILLLAASYKTHL